jgi:hypothetical protein
MISSVFKKAVAAGSELAFSLTQALSRWERASRFPLSGVTKAVNGLET